MFLKEGNKYWMITPDDGNKIIERTVIKRKGCYTCRYKGKYHLVLGPIEMGLKIGSALPRN